MWHKELSDYEISNHIPNLKSKSLKLKLHKSLPAAPNARPYVPNLMQSKFCTISLPK